MPLSISLYASINDRDLELVTETGHQYIIIFPIYLALRYVMKQNQ